MANKTRLDVLLVERQLVGSRSKAAAMIMAAEVTVDNRLVDKPGTMVTSDAQITLKEKARYVGRGGLKLEAALNAFRINPSGVICADVGASTGGFTDCLLQHGAVRIYAIDVGSGIIDYRLRRDKRVRLLENTNARYLESLEECPALVVIDVSFISLRLILPSVKRWIDYPAEVIALVKPQFEAGRSDIGKGGIVKDHLVRRRVLDQVANYARSNAFSVADIIPSPIKGAKGNVEYLMWLQAGTTKDDRSTIDKRIMALTASAE